MSLSNSYLCAWEIVPVEISSGESLTDTINLGGLRLFGMIMPTDWTPANLTFQMSPDAGATWMNMLDQNGNEILATGTASSYVALNTPQQFAANQYLRIRSGSSSLPITQAEDRVVQLLLRSV